MAPRSDAFASFDDKLSVRGILLFLNNCQQSRIKSTTIQSQGVIYLVVAKLQVGTAVAVSFRARLSLRNSRETA